MFKFSLLILSLLPLGAMAMCLPDSVDSNEAVVEEAEERPAIELREVMVKGQSLRMDAGKVVFTPGDLSNVASKGWEVLYYMPMLHVDHDDQLSFGGKPVKTILINGEVYPAPLEIVKLYLCSFTPDKIARIEILTDVEPIVNVVLKDSFDGLLGSVGAKCRYANDRISPDGSLWLGTSYGKLRASVFASGVHKESCIRTDTRYDFASDDRWAENNLEKHARFNRASAGVMLNWNLTSYDEVHAAYGFSYTERQEIRATSVSQTSDDSQPMIQKDCYSSVKPFGSPGMNANLSYSHRFGSDGGELVFAGGWSHYSGNMTDNYTSGNSGNVIDYHNKFTTFYGVARFNRSFGFGLDIDCGYVIESLDEFDYRDNGHTSDLFGYDRLSNSVYVNLNRQWSRIFSMRVSIKARHIHRKLTQQASMETHKKSWLSADPGVSLAFQLPRSNVLTLTYQMMQIEPQPEALNPFVRQWSANEFSCGNPNLDNTVFHSLTAGWMFLNSCMLSVSYNASTDLVRNIPMAVGDKVWNTGVNVGRSEGVSLYLNYWKSFFNNRLVVNADVMWLWDKTTAPDELSSLNLIARNWGFSASARATVSERHKLTASLSYSFNSPTKLVGEFRDRDSSLSLKISKTFGFGGDVSFAAYNLTNSNGKKYFESADYSYRKVRHGLQMTFTLTFGYTFGSNKVKRARSPEEMRE